MKSLASLVPILIAAASPVAAQEPPPSAGPRGTSQAAPGEVRYDAVGYAGMGDLAGVSAASGALTAGSYAEVTALDTGRTIVVAIAGGDVTPGRVVTLSAGAAAALGMSGDGFAVRVRKVTPTPQDVVQLRGGQAASFRAEAPPALLVALRKKLSPMPAAVAKSAAPAPVAKPSRPVPRPTPTAKPATPTPPPAATRPATSGYVVQVAALSNAARAAVVAKAVGGSIVAGPPLWRVRLGPYPDIAAATRAKAEAARKGYPGGQITRLP